jgi:hypothetical protein
MLCVIESLPHCQPLGSWSRCEGRRPAGADGSSSPSASSRRDAPRGQAPGAGSAALAIRREKVPGAFFLLSTVIVFGSGPWASVRAVGCNFRVARQPGPQWQSEIRHADLPAKWSPDETEEPNAGGADIALYVCARRPSDVNCPHATSEAFLRSESSPLPDRQHLSQSPHL